MNYKGLYYNTTCTKPILFAFLLHVINYKRCKLHFVNIFLSFYPFTYATEDIKNSWKLYWKFVFSLDIFKTFNDKCCSIDMTHNIQVRVV